MTKPQSNALQIKEDVSFQDFFWIVQRVGWFLLVVLVIGSILGIVGNGLLSKRNIQGGGMSVQYQFFERQLSPATIAVTLENKKAEANEITLAVSKTFLNNYQVQQIVPQPKQVSITEHSYKYTFLADKLGSNSEVTFYLQPQYPGIFSGSLTVENDKPVQLQQFVYP